MTCSAKEFFETMVAINYALDTDIAEEQKIALMNKQARMTIQIENAISDLSSIERLLIRYRYIETMTQSSIAERIELSTRHVKRLLSVLTAKVFAQ